MVLAVLGLAALGFPGGMLWYNHEREAYEAARAPHAFVGDMVFGNVTTAPCRMCQPALPAVAGPLPRCREAPLAHLCRTSEAEVCEQVLGDPQCTLLQGHLAFRHPLLPSTAAPCTVAPVAYVCPSAIPQCWPQSLQAAAGDPHRFLPSCKVAMGRSCAAPLFTNRLIGTACAGVTLRPLEYAVYDKSPGNVGMVSSFAVVAGVVVWVSMVCGLCNVGCRLMQEEYDCSGACRCRGQPTQEGNRGVRCCVCCRRGAAQQRMPAASESVQGDASTNYDADSSGSDAPLTSSAVDMGDVELVPSLRL